GRRRQRRSTARPAAGTAAGAPGFHRGDPAGTRAARLPRRHPQVLRRAGQARSLSLLRDTARRLRFLAALAAALLFGGAFVVQAARRAPDLVVYCAHDALYAEQVIDRFRTETGLSVAVRYDTEATKSLGLCEQIVRERAHPRCDVFWDNEPLGVMRLAE